MSNEFIELSQYRFERAKEDLANAEDNYKNCYYKGAINRAYYAIFHSLRAVLALNKVDSSKHSGVISEFNKLYVKTGTFDVQISKMVQSAFLVRNKSDYDDFYLVSAKEAQKQILNAKTVIDNVEKYLKEI